LAVFILPHSGCPPEGRLGEQERAKPRGWRAANHRPWCASEAWGARRSPAKMWSEIQLERLGPGWKQGPSRAREPGQGEGELSS
jgi:hypothetical protein